ncbi:SMI1/KNR4 family protein [Streptomyces sp. NPDC001508]|uniref:SMI1/KNR4 family protein n=1 Tax=Streptomyces sp. NPDC001508 TaxID=3154656 RepID=UPI00332E5B29
MRPVFELSQVRFFRSVPVAPADGFAGYYQRVGEGPIGYRGAPAEAPPRPGTAALPLRTVEQWRSFLAEEAAQGGDEERLAALEERLGTRLPPSYRAFLSAADGWLTISTFEYEMGTTSTVGWLHEKDPGLWDLIRDTEYPGNGGFWGRLLLISAEGDAENWLLDSGDVAQDGEWAAYRWDGRRRGLSERHASFAELVEAERESCEELEAHEDHVLRPEYP